MTFDPNTPDATWLHGWGFRDADALRRHINPQPVPKDGPRKFARGRFVTPAELADYAISLQKPPSHRDVQAKFKCSHSAGYRYRATVLDLMLTMLPAKGNA